MARHPLHLHRPQHRLHHLHRPRRPQAGCFAADCLPGCHAFWRCSRTQNAAEVQGRLQAPLLRRPCQKRQLVRFDLLWSASFSDHVSYKRLPTTLTSRPRRVCFQGAARAATSSAEERSWYACVQRSLITKPSFCSSHNNSYQEVQYPQEQHLGLLQLRIVTLHRQRRLHRAAGSPPMALARLLWPLALRKRQPRTL